MGKLGDADRLYRRAIGGYEITLGLDHSETLASLAKYALFLSERQDEFEEAEKLMQRAVDGSRRTHGDRHSTTLEYTEALSNLRKGARKESEAKKKLMHATRALGLSFSMFVKQKSCVYLNRRFI